MRAALYARVSTRDHDQDPETQLRVLREWSRGEHYGVPVADKSTTYEEYVDYASGGNLNRPEWKKMMDAMRRGRIKMVVVTHLDRAFRSVLDGSLVLQEFELRDVRFLPLDLPSFDTYTAVGKAMLQMSLVWAELERARLPERIKQGQARARAQGKIIGRPRVKLTVKQAVAAVEEHGSHYAAAKALNVPRSTLQLRIKEAGLA